MKTTDITEARMSMKAKLDEMTRERNELLVALRNLCISAKALLMSVNPETYTTHSHQIDCQSWVKKDIEQAQYTLVKTRGWEYDRQEG